MRGLLESAVEVWDLELGEIEEDIWQAFGDLGVHEELDEASEGLAGLKEVVRNAVSDVRLLVCEYRRPSSSFLLSSFCVLNFSTLLCRPCPAASV